MKNRRSLPLQSWQSDQWEVAIQSRPIVSTRALRTIKLARLGARPEPPDPRKTGDAPGFRLRRHRTLPRLIRRLAVQRMAAGGGVS